MNEPVKKSTRMKKAAIVSISIMALLLLAIIARGVWISWQMSLFVHPTDEELIHSLTEHREDYERLASMLQKDGIFLMTSTIYSPTGELAENRWQEYRELLGQLDVYAVSRQHAEDDSSVRFVVSTILTFRPFNGNSDKGIVFDPKDPEPLFDSFDTFPRTLEPNVEGYKQIDDDWYIFLIFEP